MERNTREGCFFCKHWQPKNLDSRVKRTYEEAQYAPPLMEGNCLAASDPKTFWLVQGTYAPTSHVTNAQQPCDVYVKKGTFLGLGLFGGRMIRAFVPRRE